MPGNNLVGELAYNEYKLALKRAEEALHKNLPGEAASAYRQCAELYRQYANSAEDPVTRRHRLERVQLYLEKASGIERPGSASARSEALHRPPGGERIGGAAPADDYESEVLNLLEKTSVRWEDIGGLEDTKAAIKSAYGLALARKPSGVKIEAIRNLLLYGPPGTGKTILAAATAGSLEANFFNVKVSNLLSKYFGESSKLITALYSAARKLSPSVVYLDEFESLAAQPGSGESGAEMRILSTFKSELDGLSTKDDKSFILTIGATNFPWLLDKAILSRFQRFIYVPLPDSATRKAIFSLFLEKRGMKSLVSADELVRRTAGFSGREIGKICDIAVDEMTRRANPGLLALVDKGQAAVREYRLQVEPVSESDFRAAFEQVKAVTTAVMLRQFEEWQRGTGA